MFRPGIYALRRHKLADALGQGLVLLLGNTHSPMNYRGNVYPFRQDGTFRYYAGLDQPGLAATLDAATGETTLYGDDLTVEDVVWEGPQPSMAERAERIGVKRTKPLAALADDVAAALQRRQPLHLLPPYRADHRLTLEALLGVQHHRLDAYVSEALLRAVVAQRSVKADYEIAEIEQAVERSRLLHVTAMRTARPGQTEVAVAGAAEGAVLAAGGVLSFPMICSVRGETLHISATNRVLQDGDLLLVDGGATSDGHYAGDITRTFPVNGRFSTPQREIYEAVLAAQQAALQVLRPGVKYLDAHLEAARALTRALQALGLMHGDADEAVAAGAHALFFPHGLGHMMGLDVHDMEALGENFVGYDDEVTRSTQFGTAYLRMARRLQPGFVVTVEPGCYFIPALIDQWRAENRHAAFIRYDALDAWRTFGGVRIEDDVVVTGESHRVLGPPIPKTVAEVEAECVSV